MEERGPGLPVCSSCPLSFVPQRLHRQLSPKHSGVALSLPGAGHSCSSQGDTGCCLA